MKNKYLTKYFCITMLSAAVLATPASVLGAETAAESTKQSEGTSASLSGVSSSADAGTSAQSDGAGDTTAVPTSAPAAPTAAPAQTTAEPTVAPTSAPAEPTAAPTAAPENPSVTPTEAPENPTVTPTVTPENPTVTPTVTPEDPSVTPTVTPENPTVTPTVTPAEPTVTPTVSPEPTKIPAKVQKIIDRIDALSISEITISSEKEIKSVRKAYNALSEEEKKQVTNYNLFVNMEKKLAEITKNDIEPVDDGGDDLVPDKTVTAVEGNPLYITNMVSNLHAGKDFYLNSLSDIYRLSFSDDFAAVMEEIEKEYKAANNLSDASDSNGVTTSEDTYLVRNWQDILAIYVYRQSLEGKESFTLDASCKEELAEIFAEMNPLVADENDPSKLVYANYHINYYIKAHKIAKEDREILKKYTETDCSLLCAVVTGARGFVRQSVGEDVSEERVNVVTAAYSLIGKVGYFWGGKYAALGENPSWGSVMLVTASGSKSTGSLRAYGLDCSGFVTWSVINGYQDTSVQSAIGDGTTDQWLKAEVISEADAQPGDLVFQAGPESGTDNHVGIICGKTDAGDWIVVHCSSTQNGVTVGEAYGAGFRYIRRPTVYVTAGSILDIDAENDNALTSIESIVVENPLAGLQESEASEVAEFVGPVFMAVDDAAENSTGSEAESVQADAEAESVSADSMKQVLSGIKTENALAALKANSSQNVQAVPVSTATVVSNMMTQNALLNLLRNNQTQNLENEKTQTSKNTESAAVHTVAYVAAGGSGKSPIGNIHASNALLSILK